MAEQNYSPIPRKSNSKYILQDTIDESVYGYVPKTSPAANRRSPYLTNLNNDGGLAATAVPSTIPSIDPYQQYRDGYNDAQQKINPPPQQTETAYRSGPSEKVANTVALGGLAIGALSSFDGMKTAKLQRESLRQDLATAREHNQRRRDSLASFNSGWA